MPNPPNNPIPPSLAAVFSDVVRRLPSDVVFVGLVVVDGTSLYRGDNVDGDEQLVANILVQYLLHSNAATVVRAFELERHAKIAQLLGPDATVGEPENPERQGL